MCLAGRVIEDMHGVRLGDCLVDVSDKLLNDHTDIEVVCLTNTLIASPGSQVYYVLSRLCA